MKYIKFVGDYSKLKFRGYSFQRLFASNYMQWEKNGLRVWKKGAELTIDELTNFEGAFFELFLNTVSFPLLGRKYLSLYINRKTHEVTLDRTAYDTQFLALAAYDTQLNDKFPVSESKGINDGYEKHQWQQEQGDLIGIERVDYDWCNTTINITTLESIRELNDDGWLELAE